MQTEKKRNINAGHRSRMREKLQKSGADSFLSHELLEMLLFYAMPRCDTNPIAHRLLDRFGSLDALFSASVQEMTTVDGVGEKTAQFMKLCSATAAYAIASAEHDARQFSSVNELGDFAVSVVKETDEPSLYLILLDNRFVLIDTLFLGKYTINSPRISAKDIAGPALRTGAAVVALVAHRPGVLYPPPEEVVYAKELSDRLRIIGINMAEYFAVCKGRWLACSSSVPGGFAQRPDLAAFFGKGKEVL